MSQIFFSFVFCVSVGLFGWRFAKIRRNILLGKAETINADKATRWKNVLLLALGQKKMFKKPIVALLHLAVYFGFIVINIEVLEIILDGILGTHRIFLPLLGNIYPVIINAFEWLALAVIISCAFFLIRRNFLHIRRFTSSDITGWPKTDANYILFTEILLMLLFLNMNAADSILQQRDVKHYTTNITGFFTVSFWLTPLLQNASTSFIIGFERACWWLHIGGILAFLNYLPFSKHLHIILAFPNAYFTRNAPTGKMQNMPEIQKEVWLAMGADISTNTHLSTLPDAPPAQFGAKDVFDLSWKNLLDAYSCTECGRCSAVCPASITGKQLSPRNIMMKTRDRIEEASKIIDKNRQWKDDGKSLLHHYITTDELRACTTCNACVDACPISISPLDIILKQRRYLILDETNSTTEWNAMFTNIENNMAPWKFSPNERENWIDI